MIQTAIKKNIHSIHIDSDENMIVTTNKYSCDMYISTLFTSSVILKRWSLISTPDIFKYMLVLLLSSACSGASPWPSAIIFNRNYSSSASVCRGSIVTKIWIQIKPLKNYLNNPLQKFAAGDRRRAEGRRRRAQSWGPEAHWGERGAGGTGAQGELWAETERIILLHLGLRC